MQGFESGDIAGSAQTKALLRTNMEQTQLQWRGDGQLSSAHVPALPCRAAAGGELLPPGSTVLRGGQEGQGAWEGSDAAALADMIPAS